MRSCPPSRYAAFRRAQILLVVALIGALGSIPPATAAPRAAELIPITLQLKWRHQFQFAGYYAAKAQGYYEAAGLDVQFVEATTGAEPVDVVLRGDADFGIAASDLVLSRAQGKPVVALAAIFQHSPLILLALERTGIDTVHDLAGRRVAVESNAAELLAYLEYEGVAIETIEQLPHNFSVDPLLSGRVAALSAYSTDEPFLLREADLDYRIFNPRSAGIDFYGDTLFTTEQQIRERPDVVRAFVAASLRGWDYALDNPDELIELIRAEYSTRHSAAHLAFEAEHTRRLILPDVIELGYLNPGRWRHIADTYADLGMMPVGFSLDGFLYNPNPRPDYTLWYASFLAVVTVLGVVSYVAMRFFRLNVAIRSEMAERRRIEGHLRALEKRYRTLAEQAPFPVIISRPADGTVRYMNTEALHVFGLSRERAIGMQAVELYEHSHDRESLITDLIATGRVRLRELRLRTAAGELFWAGMSATMIEFEEEPAAFVALMNISERKELEQQLQALAMTDALTGLFNRRYFTQRGAHEIRRAQRYHQPLGLLVFDVDHFKQVNDTYGHAAGDAVLQMIAATLRATLRDIDVPGRLGGEEFGVLLPNTRLADARRIAERLRMAIAAAYTTRDGVELRVTASFGVSAIAAENEDLDDLLRAADAALYRAKSEGRDRVVSAGDVVEFG